MFKLAKLVYQRKNGKWEARYHKGKSADGRALYGTVYGDTEADVIFRRIEVLGFDPETAGMTFEMNLLIIGAGVHGRDCREIAESLRIFKKIKFLDDVITNNVEIIGKTDEIAHLRSQFPCAFVAIGDNAARKKFVERLRTANYLLPSLISPMANISPKAKIGDGVVAFPGCNINEAEIGDFAIVDTSSVIGSGTKLGEYTRVDCGGIVLKKISVPAGTWIKSGKIYG